MTIKQIQCGVKYVFDLCFYTDIDILPEVSVNQLSKVCRFVSHLHKAMAYSCAYRAFVLTTDKAGYTMEREWGVLA
jgi:hypothetical protein